MGEQARGWMAGEAEEGLNSVVQKVSMTMVVRAEERESDRRSSLEVMMVRSRERVEEVGRQSVQAVVEDSMERASHRRVVVRRVEKKARGPRLREEFSEAAEEGEGPG